MPAALYHFSEEPDIVRFDPRPSARPSASATDPLVWAIDDEHQHNYLLPRDCPRVTFYAVPTTTAEDIAHLLTGVAARHGVAIEARWLPMVRQTRLLRYALPTANFVAAYPGAGYYVSRDPVVPLEVTPIPDLLEESTRHDVELRINPNPWSLSDAVVASTLQFSNIRMR